MVSRQSSDIVKKYGLPSQADSAYIVVNKLNSILLHDVITNKNRVMSLANQFTDGWVVPTPLNASYKDRTLLLKKLEDTSFPIWYSQDFIEYTDEKYYIKPSYFIFDGEPIEVPKTEIPYESSNAKVVYFVLERQSIETSTSYAKEGFKVYQDVSTVQGEEQVYKNYVYNLTVKISPVNSSREQAIKEMFKGKVSIVGDNGLETIIVELPIFAMAPKYFSEGEPTVFTYENKEDVYYTDYPFEKYDLSYGLPISTFDTDSPVGSVLTKFVEDTNSAMEGLFNFYDKCLTDTETGIKYAPMIITDIARTGYVVTLKQIKDITELSDLFIVTDRGLSLPTFISTSSYSDLQTYHKAAITDDSILNNLTIDPDTYNTLLIDLSDLNPDSLEITSHQFSVLPDAEQTIIEEAWPLNFDAVYSKETSLRDFSVFVSSGLFEIQKRNFDIMKDFDRRERNTLTDEVTGERKSLAVEVVMEDNTPKYNLVLKDYDTSLFTDKGLMVDNLGNKYKLSIDKGIMYVEQVDPQDVNFTTFYKNYIVDISTGYIYRIALRNGTPYLINNNVTNTIFVDEATSREYSIHVHAGEVVLRPDKPTFNDSGNFVAGSDITNLFDEATGKSYSLYVKHGKIEIREIKKA